MDTMPATKPPVQLELFPCDEDSVLFSRSAMYQSLGDTGRRVVRAYLACLERTGKLPTQSDLARTSGLSRHAVSDQLGDRASAAWRAITEVLATFRDELAVRSSVAIPQLAWLIIQQFLPGGRRLPRETSSLTKVELEVLRAAAAMGGCSPLMGGDATIQVSAGVADGKAVAVAAVRQSDDSLTLADLVSKLQAGVIGQPAGVPGTAAGHPAALVDGCQSAVLPVAEPAAGQPDEPASDVVQKVASAAVCKTVGGQSEGESQA